MLRRWSWSIRERPLEAAQEKLLDYPPTIHYFGQGTFDQLDSCTKTGCSFIGVQVKGPEDRVVRALSPTMEYNGENIAKKQKNIRQLKYLEISISHEMLDKLYNE